jgi:mRNA-degrading endonuclease HigB of HigAB toxin-antitoxin module
VYINYFKLILIKKIRILTLPRSCKIVISWAIDESENLIHGVQKMGRRFDCLLKTYSFNADKPPEVLCYKSINNSVSCTDYKTMFLVYVVEKYGKNWSQFSAGFDVFKAHKARSLKSKWSKLQKEEARLLAIKDTIVKTKFKSPPLKVQEKVSRWSDENVMFLVACQDYYKVTNNMKDWRKIMVKYPSYFEGAADTPGSVFKKFKSLSEKRLKNIKEQIKENKAFKEFKVIW